MLCKNCGKELADSALMCPNCGAPTENWQKVMPVAAPVTEPAPKSDEPAKAEKQTAKEAHPAPAPASAASFRIPGQPAEHTEFRTPAQKPAPSTEKHGKDCLPFIGFIFSAIAFFCGFILITCAFAAGGAAGALSGSVFYSVLILLPAFIALALDLYGLFTLKSGVNKTLALVGTILSGVIIFYYFLGIAVGLTL